MLPQYKKKTKIWVILSFFSRFIGGFLLVIGISQYSELLLIIGYVFLIILGFICLFAASWNHAKGKGYSRAIGFLLGFLDIIGLIIMIILPNRYKKVFRKYK